MPADLQEAQAQDATLACNRGVLLKEATAIGIAQQRRAVTSFPICGFDSQAFCQQWSKFSRLGSKNLAFDRSNFFGRSEGASQAGPAALTEFAFGVAPR